MFENALIVAGGYLIGSIPVGVVVVSLVLSRKGAVLADPLAVIDGVPAANAEGDDMLDIVLDTVDGTLRSIPPQNRKNPESIAESVRRAVRAAVNEAWGKKPICKVLVNLIGTKG